MKSVRWHAGSITPIVGAAGQGRVEARDPGSHLGVRAAGKTEDAADEGNPTGAAALPVVMNATSLRGPATGISRYVQGIADALALDRRIDLLLFDGSKLTKLAAAQTMSGGRGVHDDGGGNRFTRGLRELGRRMPGVASLRHQLTGRRWLRALPGADTATVYHEPGFLAHPHAGPTVVTVHDLSFLDLPQTHPAARVRFLQRELPRSLARADHVLVVSEATRRALLRWFPMPADRVSVTHLAAHWRFRPHGPDELAELARTRWCLRPKGYVLCVGTLEPRKNLELLLRAHGALPETLRRRFPLVVAGMRGWMDSPLGRLAEPMVLRGDVMLTGFVPERWLPLLVAGAALFCQPSRYEGFGLPALEAMASGVPVIACDTTSMPEVVGDAGLLVDPDDVAGLRSMMIQVLEDDALATMLGEAGLRRASTFTWRGCAESTRAGYLRGRIAWEARR